MALSDFLDPRTLAETFGLLGIIAVVFAESGLFFGFFFPGDSLLFVAGLLASQGVFNVYVLYIGCLAAAILGDSVGYAFGRKAGVALFTRDDSLFFNRAHLVRAEHFYEAHGKKTIILARFIPIVRTFAPIVAGIGSMPYRTFLLFNITGGFLWTTFFIWGGYFLGTLVPGIERYVEYIALGIVFFSLLPFGIKLLRAR